MVKPVKHPRIIRDESGGGGELKHFYYSKQWQVLVEADPNNVATAMYGYHPQYVDAVATRIRDADAHLYLHDANYNVTAVADPNGTTRGGTCYFFGDASCARLPPMPRTARASVGGMCYHVLNRGNARQKVFRKSDDYAAFLKLLIEASERLPMRLLGYCLMPNHFHLVLRPREDGDLSRWMQWLLTSHVRRYHRHYESSGHVWQGRFKAFPIQSDEHLLTVMRYVERNPVRAKSIPVRKAQNWPWSSAGTPPKAIDVPKLSAGPVRRRRNWLAWVNRPQTEAELAALRACIARGKPFGGERWQRTTAHRLGLESSLRSRGRPRKK